MAKETPSVAQCRLSRMFLSMAERRISKRGFFSGAMGALLVTPGVLMVPAARDGAKDLMDHWKTGEIVVKEVEIVDKQVVVEEVPVEVVKEIPVEVERIKEVPVEVEVVKEKIVYRDIEADPEAPPPPPLPLSFVPNKEVSVKDLFNEMQIRTDVAVRKGSLPSVERKRDESYQAHFQVVVNVPQASDSMKELVQVNGKLPSMLPGLSSMMSKPKVSGFFHLLYKHKLEHLKEKMVNLEKTLSRHNFYDCQTILELTHPSSKQKVLLVQSDMDVVADGSDGDRLSVMDAEAIRSPTYQPETSYRWPKRTNRPNPLLTVYRERLTTVQSRLKAKGLGVSEKAQLTYQAKHLPSTIAGLQKQSFLIAREDPFIVLPLSMRPYVDHHPHTPRMGDYAVVIYKDKLYPAICGDYGPQTKIGEGSLRLAKALNPKSNPNYRPVSDVTVTYLIFPNSRDLPPGPPNYARWQQRCQQLLNKIGGLSSSYRLHTWQDRLSGQVPAPSGQPRGLLR